MDVLVTGSLVTLSVAAVASAGLGKNRAASKSEDGDDSESRKRYISLRRTYFGAYFFAVFGTHDFVFRSYVLLSTY